MASLCSARLPPSPSLDVLGFLSPTKTKMSSDSRSFVCSSSRVYGFSSSNRCSRRNRNPLHVVAMAPEEEKLTRRNPLDFPIDRTHLLESQQRACTLEAELALLLRISHKYRKPGEVLFSMGALEHSSSCRAISFKGNMRRVDMKLQSGVGYDVQNQRTIITAVLRLVFALTSLVETSELFEGRNKIVREVTEFIKGHQFLFDQLLREDFTQPDDLLME